MDDQEPANGHNTPRKNRYPDWIIRGIGRIKAKRQQRRTEDYHKSASDRAAGKTVLAAGITVLLTAVIAAVGIGQYVVFSGQLTVMQGQLDEMKATDAIQMSQLSPRIKFADLDIQQAIIVHPGYWQLTPKWINNGQGAAEKFRGWDEVEVFPGDIPADFDCTKPKYPVPEPPNSTVERDESLTQQTLFLAPSVARLAASGGASIIIFGGIEWNDAFPNTPRHYRLFAYRLFPQVDGEAVKWTLPLIYRSDCNRSGDEK